MAAFVSTQKVPSNEETIYQEWVKSLPPNELAKLSVQYRSYADDHGKVSGHLSEDEDPANRAVGDLNEPKNHHDDDARAKHELINRIVGMLLSAPNVRVSVLGLVYALNLSEVNGLGSMGKSAKTFLVTKSSISNAATAWHEHLGLEATGFKSPHLKTPGARKASKKAQLTPGKHWRKKTYHATRHPSTKNRPSDP